MRPTGLILCIALVAMLCDACQPSVQIGAGAQAVVAESDPCKQVKKIIRELRSGYDPVAATTCDPAISACDDPTEAVNIADIDAISPAADIVAACNIAPSFFQLQLADLRRIYIDPDPSQDKPLVWGLRQRKVDDPDHLGHKKKNIGISSSVWRHNIINPNAPYSSYETLLVNALLNKHTFDSRSSAPPPNAATWLAGLQYTATPDPTPAGAKVTTTPRATAILAILAHEMGHIIWWKCHVLDQMLDPQNRSKIFYTWRSVVPEGSRLRFHGFGEEEGDKSTSDFDKDNIIKDIYMNPPDISSASTKLNAVYGNGNWTGLFAFVSVDEDFIETYKLYVLTHAQPGAALTSLNFQQSGQQYKILDYLNDPSSNLAKKIAWIDRWVNSSNPPCL